MANCAIYEKGKDEITYFVKNCIREGRNFTGSNMRLTGVKETVFDVKWTEDEAVRVYEIKNDESTFIGYDKKVSELSEALRFMGEVVSNRDDVNRVIRDRIAGRYSTADETKLLRLRYTGKLSEEEWAVYDAFIEDLRQEGRKFKNEYFK